MMAFVVCAPGIAALCVSDWFNQTAAEWGFRSSQHELGWKYATGRGVAKNGNEAVKWFTKAAEQGDNSAQFYLGFMYVEGDGVEKNDVEAIRWFTMAADQGYGPAQGMLGLMYRNGEGVEKDAIAAYMWYDLAGKGRSSMESELDALETEMSEEAVVEAKNRSSKFRAKSWKEMKAQIGWD